VNPKDLVEMSRRLAEEEDLLTYGYNPAYPYRREPWIKCHAGEVICGREALIARHEEQAALLEGQRT
jgi:hypothetical protein